MKNIRFSISSFLMIFLLTNLSAQETIQTPKDNKIASSFTKNEEYKMKWYALNDTSKIEIGDVYTKILKTDKQINMTTTVRMKNNPDWIDESIAELPYFSPLKHTSTNVQRDMLLNFEYENIVTGYYTDKTENKKNEINEATNGDYFDSNLYPQLIRWLPLKEGYTTSISIFDYNPKSSIGIMKAYVTDTKKGSLNNKAVWLVSVTDDISQKQALSVYYIDANTREILKQEISMGTRKMLMERN